MAVLTPTAEEMLTNWDERRTSRRRSLQEVPGIIGVSLRSQPVDVINVSSGGLLIQCGLRLTPGEASPLEILHKDGPLRVRGRVVRSEVAVVSGRGMQYRIAIAFTSTLNCVDEPEIDAASALLIGDFVKLPLIVDAEKLFLPEGFRLNGW